MSTCCLLETVINSYFVDVQLQTGDVTQELMCGLVNGPHSSDRSAVSLGHLMKNSGEMTVLQRAAGSVLFVRDVVVDLLVTYSEPGCGGEGC